MNLKTIKILLSLAMTLLKSYRFYLSSSCQLIQYSLLPYQSYSYAQKWMEFANTAKLHYCGSISLQTTSLFIVKNKRGGERESILLVTAGSITHFQEEECRMSIAVQKDRPLWRNNERLRSCGLSTQISERSFQLKGIYLAAWGHPNYHTSQSGASFEIEG